MENHSDRFIINSKDHTIADFPTGLQIIFDYLPARDLISCLAVCKATNIEIATSVKLMDKIVLKIPEDNSSVAKSILNLTNRKYQHISIQSTNEFTLDFHNDHFQWKSLHIHRAKFGPPMWDFLQQFQESIVELIFTNNEVEHSTQRFPFFAKLKTLQIKCELTETAMIYSRFYSNYKTLKNLQISQYGFEYAINVIRRTRNPAQLETIHFTLPKVQRKWTLEHALNTQRNCLTELSIEKIDTSSMEYIWKEMKVLKKLTMGSKIPDFDDDMNLEVNNSIKDIVIHSPTVPIGVFGHITYATPNLKTLQITNKNDQQGAELIIIKTTGLELRTKFQELEIIFNLMN